MNTAVAVIINMIASRIHHVSTEGQLKTLVKLKFLLPKNLVKLLLKTVVLTTLQQV